jgi:gluconokinase
MKARFIIIMGVSGSSKTTVGKALAARLEWDFYDADDFHPPANIAKLASGIPLTDEDRQPWLKLLHDLIGTCLKKERPGILACSALKDSYRQTLIAGNQDVRIVFLKGSYELIQKRMAERTGYYMKPEMLQSQFEALEEPSDALTVEVGMTVEKIVEKIEESFRV